MHLDAGGQENCRELSVLAIIHLSPSEYGKIEDQKFGTKLIIRVNVNTSFFDMEGKAVR